MRPVTIVVLFAAGAAFAPGCDCGSATSQASCDGTACLVVDAGGALLGRIHCWVAG